MSIVATAQLAPVGYAQEAMQQLREALQHLPPEEKEVFLLRQNGELTYEQIAQRDNRSVEVVKEQMRSALRKLRTVIQEVSSGNQARCFWNGIATKSHPFRPYQEPEEKFKIERAGSPFLTVIRGPLKKFRATGPEGWEGKTWTGTTEQEVFEKCRADLKECGFSMEDEDFRL